MDGGLLILTHLECEHSNLNGDCILRTQAESGHGKYHSYAYQKVVCKQAQRWIFCVFWWSPAGAEHKTAGLTINPN